MKRMQILKFYSQRSHLKKNFTYFCSVNHLSTRQFSNGSVILRQKLSSPFCQSVSEIRDEFPGVIKSPFLDLEEIPSDLTIDKYMWENVEKWPNHIAVECAVTRQKYTYSQMNVLTKKFAVSVQKRGYKVGQVISTMLPNMPDHVVSIIGSIEAGLIVSPINPTYTPFELSHQLYDCGAVAIITLPNFVEKVREAEELIRTKHKIDYKLDIIVVNCDSTSSIPDGASNFQEMISNQVDHNELQPNNRTIDDVAILPYSSGTTGLAKGVQLTHRNCVSNCIQIFNPDSHHYLPTSESYQDVSPTVLPIFHIYGFTVLMVRALRYGVKMVTLPKFDVAPFLSALKDYRATVLYVAPPILLFLGSHPNITDDHMASIRVICNGAGPVSQSDADRVLNRFKSKFFISQGYGLTETSPVISVSAQNENDVFSVGKLTRSTNAKIIKSDGNIAMAGEHGEVCVKGPQVMLGYHKNLQATKEVIDDDGYFHTGDIGYYDESGKFHIVDRLKELIKVRGFQVPPAELEGLLRSHEAVADAAVIGVPDVKTGEKPWAFVVAKNKDAVKASELIDFVSSKVAPFKKLSNVIFVDSIPKSQAGKILRRILREKYVN